MATSPVTAGGALAEYQWKAFVSRLLGDSFFDRSSSVVGARAPGRLDVLGGVADYSGGTVLEATLADATCVAAQQRTDRLLRIRTEGVRETGLRETVEIGLDELIRNECAVNYPEVSAAFNAEPAARWAAYVAGCLHVLVHERLLPADRASGLNLHVASDVPSGAGVSSSAALEVASMLAICGALGVPIDGLTLARLCQVVENRIVGAPCGIMDQVTSALGRENHLLVLKCQPHDLLGHVPIPREWRFVGLDSGVKHAVGGRAYRRARTAAFMGFKILQVFSRDRWGGYLCNVSPDSWRPWRERIPESLSGHSFAEQFGGLDDPVSRIDPDETYLVRACAEHAILENDRVRQFMALMPLAGSEPDEQLLSECGKIMLDAHHSYSERLDLGASETDLLVELAMDQGPANGIFGAKITGGGSGGTVALLCSGDDSDRAIERIRRAYEQSNGIYPRTMTGSSPGAIEFGVRAN